MPKQRHVRVGDDLADDDTVVVRGGELDAELLRADAQRYHAVYGSYGLSVFAARGVSVDELAQQPPLVRFSVLILVRVGVLRAAGFGVDPPRCRPVGVHHDVPPNLSPVERDSGALRRRNDTRWNEGPTQVNSSVLSSTRRNQPVWSGRLWAKAARSAVKRDESSQRGV